MKEFLQSYQLSENETFVFDLATRGYSNQEMAEKLSIPQSTVKFLLTESYKKLKVESRAQLIIKCIPHLEFTQPICDL
jgi:DNA-binding NarL/FixJ family response regulator